MKETRTYCFAHSSGEDIYLFTLCNSKGTKVCITNYGGIIKSFSVQPDNDIVLGFAKVEDYISEKYLAANPYFGTAIGRYGNRIKDGRFSIEDKEYILKKNSGTGHLHGGATGFDKKVWDVSSFSPDSLVLNYQSADGEEGYPGKLDVTLQFALNEENELSYEYAAIADRPTAVNLTHHSYFNLNNGKGMISDHFIKINALSILEQDENLTVTGKLIEVNKTNYDFRQCRKISKDWDPARGYDQSFVLDKTDQLSPAAEAYSKESGIKLQVFTTEPVVHFYTGKSIPVIGGKDRNMYGPFSGFCLETQVHPNAVNIPRFPNTILRPGETYHHKTVYKVTQL